MSRVPGESFSKPELWPKLDAEYLDVGQIDYEIEIRNLGLFINRGQDHSYSSVSLKQLNREIQLDPYDPLTILDMQRNNPDSDLQVKKDEVKDCREAANMLRDLTSSKEILHRAIHLFFRLKRINFGNNIECEERKKSIYSILLKHISDVLCRWQLEQSYRTAPSNVDAPQTISPPTMTPETATNVTQSSPLANSTLETPPQATVSQPQTYTTQDPIWAKPMCPPQYTTASSLGGAIPKVSDYARLINANANCPKPSVANQTQNISFHENHILNSNVPLIPELNNHMRYPSVPYSNPSSRTYGSDYQLKPNYPTMNVPYSNPSNEVQVSNYQTTQNYANDNMNYNIFGQHNYPVSTCDLQYDQYIPVTQPRMSAFSIPPPHVPLPGPQITDVSSEALRAEVAELRREMADERQNSNYSRPNTRFQEEANELKKLQALSRWKILFSGDKVDERHQSIEDYIAAIHSFVDSQQVSEAAMMTHILPTLAGTARTWFLTVPNTRNMSLRQYVNALRSRFADKRNKVEIIKSLGNRVFDFKQGYIIDHIDHLMLDMAYESFSEEDKLHIVLGTLPTQVKGYAASRNVRTVEELKTFCQVIYPPTVRLTSKEKKTDHPIRKVMKLDYESEHESEPENLEDIEDESFTQLCHLISRQLRMKPMRQNRPNESRFKPPEFKPEIKPGFKPEPKPESVTKTSEHLIDVAKVDGSMAIICFNCRLFGHNHENCTAPRLQAFCYKCGWPGVYTNSCKHCLQREQKN